MSEKDKETEIALVWKRVKGEYGDCLTINEIIEVVAIQAGVDILSVKEYIEKKDSS